MSSPSIQSRIDHLKKFTPPDSLPPGGGYEIEIKLKKPIRTGLKSWLTTSETISENGFIGMSDEVLPIYKSFVQQLEAAKAKFLSDLGPPEFKFANEKDKADS